MAKTPRRVWNHYTCPTCKKKTISKDEDEGVTPFMVKCRATPGCTDMALSGIYRGSQDNSQVPHIIWFLPKTPQALEAEFAKYRPMVRMSMRDHVSKGGLLMRDGPASIVADHPLDLTAWCPGCSATRSVYLAGNQGTAAPGSTCCATCQRVIIGVPRL